MSESDPFHSGHQEDDSLRAAFMSAMLREFEYLRPMAEMFTGEFGYTVRFSPQAETFSFRHETREIIVSPSLLERHGLSELEARYVFMHELAHLWQVLSSPDAYLESFRMEEEKGKEYGQRYGDQAGSFVKATLGKTFNLLLDVNCNKRVDTIPQFEAAGPTPVRTGLYEKIYGASDLSSEPFSSQYMDAIMRSLMVPNGAPMRVHSEVAEQLNQQVKIMGATYPNMSRYIWENIGRVNENFGQVWFRIKRFVLPVVEDLIKKDIAAGRMSFTERQSPMGAGTGKGTMESLANSVINNRSSASDKAKKSLSQAQEEEWRKQGFNENERVRMAEIQAATEEPIRDAKSIWRMIMERTVDKDLEPKSGYRSGSGIDMDRVARILPMAQIGELDPRFFTRETLVDQKESIKPKKITLVLVPDLSGSMNEEKKESVQENTYALVKSLIQHKRDMQMEVAEGEDSPIEIGLRMIAYGTTVEEAFPLRATELNTSTLEDDDMLDTRLWKSIHYIMNTNLVNTNSHLALNQAKDYLQKVAESEEDHISICIEITDGDTSSAEVSHLAKEAIQKIPRTYAGGIHIPGGFMSSASEHPEREGQDANDPPRQPEPRTPQAETGTFKKVWGKDGFKLANLSQLKKALLAILAKAIISDNSR